jgi:poly(3-hydroxybutyrate) depolymerase
MVMPPRRGDERFPIVFHYHGHGNLPASEADRTKLDQLAASQRFVLVYPAAINGCWSTRNTYPGSGRADCDVRFFDCLLKHLLARPEIDRTRVYVSGMSLGAVFAHELAVARPHSIAAAVAHSGPAPERTDCRRPVPIMIVVGANEQLMLAAARRDLHRYRALGHPSELLIAPSMGHAWDRRHNLRMWRFLARYRLEE